MPHENAAPRSGPAASPAPVLEVGPHGMVRVAAWPLEAVEPLRSPSLVDQIRSWQVEEQQLRSRGDALADAIAALVPKVDGNLERGAILALRRSLRRDGNVVDRQYQRAAGWLVANAPEVAVRVAAHLDERRRCQDQARRARAAFDDECDRERAALLEASSDERFRCALALGAPSLYERWQRDRTAAPSTAGRTRSRVRRRELAVAAHLLRASGRPVPSALWAGVAALEPADDGGTKDRDTVALALGGGADLELHCRPLPGCTIDTAIEVDTTALLEVVTHWATENDSILDPPWRADNPSAFLRELDDQVPEAHRDTWNAALEAIDLARDRLRTALARGEPHVVADARAAVAAPVHALRADVGLSPRPDDQLVRVDHQLPWRFWWSAPIRERVAQDLGALAGLQAIDGGAELWRRATMSSFAAISDAGGTLFDAVPARAPVQALTLDRVRAFDRFRDPSVRAAASTIAQRWEEALAPVRDEKAVDLMALPAVGMALASCGVEAAGPGLGPVGTCVAEVTSTGLRYLAPRPEPVTFSSRHFPFVAQPVAQARAWLAAWSDAGVDAYDVVAADPTNPNAALIPVISPRTIDARDDLRTWRVELDERARPWLWGNSGRPAVSLVHHASVIGETDAASAMLRQLSTGFGWELPAAVFPILPAERRSWTHLPELRVGSGPIVTRERWVVDGQTVAAVCKRGDEFERFAAWCELAADRALPATVTARVSGSPNEPGRLVLTDSVVAVAALFEGLSPDTPQLVLEAGPLLEDGVALPGSGHHVVQLVPSWREPQHFRRLPPPRRSSSGRWRQVNLRFPIHDTTGPIVPWAELDARVARWRTEGIIERWYFVRKPPGLRARFEVRDDAALLAAIGAWDEAVAGVYEPEEERFGGPIGQDLLHKTLVDTTAFVVALEREVVGGDVWLRTLRYPIAALLAAGFIEAATLDGSEAVDVWRRLDALFDEPGRNADGSADVRAALADPPTFVASLPQRLGERTVVALAGATEAGRQTHEAVVGGALRVGLRAWLTDVVLFTWNTFGLGLDEDRMAATVRAGLAHTADAG